MTTTKDIPPPKSYTDGGDYSLDKIDLPEAHIVNGREFPVAYQLNLNGTDYDQTKAEAILAKFSNDGTFTRLLEDHGVVVLRDTLKDSDDTKAPQLAQLIKTVEENRGLTDFQQNGTLTLRSKVGYNLYVANAKSPADARIPQHNEYSRFKRWPTTIDFSIPEYTATGGETPLVHGKELFHKVKETLPEFLDKLSKYGLQFKEETWPKEPAVPGGVIWNHEVTYGRYIKPEDDLETQKSKAEQVAKEYISDKFKWADNGDFVVSSLTQPVKTFKGEPLIFSSIAAFGGKYSELDDPKIRYGNGDLFDNEDLKKFIALTQELEYKHNWKSGDLVFVHNYQVSHGKLPYKDGKRQILVGMWDEKVPDRSKLFVDYSKSLLDENLSKLTIN